MFSSICTYCTPCSLEHSPLALATDVTIMIAARSRTIITRASHCTRRSASSVTGDGPAERVGVVRRVKKDKKGIFAVAASSMAFILSAQSFSMRNERDDAIERAEAAEKALAEYKQQLDLPREKPVASAQHNSAPTGGTSAPKNTFV